MIEALLTALIIAICVIAGALSIAVAIDFADCPWREYWDQANAVVDFDTLMTMYKSDPKKGAWDFKDYLVWYNGNRKLAMASRHDYYRYRRFVKKHKKQEDTVKNNEVLLQITKEIRTRVSNTVDNENAKLRKELEHYKEIAERIKKEGR